MLQNLTKTKVLYSAGDAPQANVTINANIESIMNYKLILIYFMNNSFSTGISTQMLCTDCIEFPARLTINGFMRNGEITTNDHKLIFNSETSITRYSSYDWLTIIGIC